MITYIDASEEQMMTICYRVKGFCKEDIVDLVDEIGLYIRKLIPYASSH